MRLIYKYPLAVGETIIDDMPINAKILSVQSQQDQICLWAEFDPSEEEIEERTFVVVGTGHLFEADRRKYIGTCQLADGVFVGHVYEMESNG